MSLNRFVDTAAGGKKGTLGEAAVKKALASGISKKDLIKRAQSQGINFGSAAQSLLKISGQKQTSSPSSGSNSSPGSWRTADYGESFGKKDIKNLSKSGFNNNRIMKIAQAAYAGGDVKKVNKLNSVLGKMNQDLINPDPTNPRALLGRKAPKNLLGWNGFGNGMTRYVRDGILGLGGSYKPRGGTNAASQWSLPTGMMNGFNPIPNTTPTETPSPTEPSPTETPNPTETPKPTETPNPTEEFLPGEDLIPEDEELDEPLAPASGGLSGGGLGAAGATKLGRAKSRLRKLGIYGRGTGLLGRGLQYGNSLNA